MKQRISAPQSNGGARKVAPRARSASYAARQSATRSVIAWLTWSGSGGGAKTTPGLSAVGPPPVTSSSHVPAKRSTTLVPPDSRYSSAPRTFTQKSRDRAGSATTRMWVTATSGPSGPACCCCSITSCLPAADGMGSLRLRSAGLPVTAEDLGPQPRAGRAQGRQDGRDGAVGHRHDREAEMLHPDLPGVFGPGLTDRVPQALLGPGGERDAPRASGPPLTRRRPPRRAGRMRPAPGRGRRPPGLAGPAHPAAHPVPPARPPGRRRGEGARAERRLDLAPDRVEIDADGGQRVPVEDVGQAGPAAGPGQPHRFPPDPIGRDPPVPQDRADLAAGGGEGEQQVLAADPVMAQSERALPGARHHAAGVTGEPFQHHRLPVRPPCLRCTVCLVTPSRSAISFHDQPSARALSTWRISSCSVRTLSAFTARSPTSGSLLAAFPASSSVASMPVSIC